MVNKKGTYICTDCGEKFRVKVNYNAHLEKCLNKKEKKLMEAYNGTKDNTNTYNN